MGWKRNKKRGGPACRRTEWVKLEHFGQMLARRPVKFLTCEIDPYGLYYLKKTGGLRENQAEHRIDRLIYAADCAVECNEHARTCVPKPARKAKR